MLFSELPTEIQVMVWRLLVPNPRSIRGALLFIVNLELGNPKAILPSIRDFKRASSLANPYDVDDDDDMEEALEFWGVDDDSMYSLRRPILSLLHTCRASRTVVLEKYRLDLVSTLPEENTTLWNPEEDMVYFPPPLKFQEARTFLYWLSLGREAPRPSLSSLQHVAFQLNGEASSGLGLNEFPEELTNVLENQWLHNFPALKSFSL
jgi:hypothetical protein